MSKIGPYQVGDVVFVKTVGEINVGRIGAIDLTDRWLVLEDASWAANVGRVGDALKDGELKEVEPYPAPYVMGLDYVLSMTSWSGPCPYPQTPADD